MHDCCLACLVHNFIATSASFLTLIALCRNIAAALNCRDNAELSNKVGAPHTYFVPSGGGP